MALIPLGMEALRADPGGTTAEVTHARPAGMHDMLQAVLASEPLPRYAEPLPDPGRQSFPPDPIQANLWPGTLGGRRQGMPQRNASPRLSMVLMI